MSTGTVLCMLHNLNQKNEKLIRLLVFKSFINVNNYFLMSNYLFRLIYLLDLIQVMDTNFNICGPTETSRKSFTAHKQKVDNVDKTQH